MIRQHAKGKKRGTRARFEICVVLSFGGIIQFLTFTLTHEIIGWPYWPCYLSALVLSVLWNFTLNREFTFKSTANIPRAMTLVALYYCVFASLRSGEPR